MVTQPLSGLTTDSHGTYVIAYSINTMSQVTAVLQPNSAGGAVAVSVDQTSNADPGARAESSTADSQDIRRTEGELARLLEVIVAYREEMAFLDAALTAFTSTRGPAGLVDIAVAADRGQLPELDLTEVMKTVSNWREPEFIKIVGWFIGRFLTHPSAAVRAGALAALIQLEDSSTVSNLEKAREAERDPHLRHGMSRGMDYLRAINARAVT